MALLGIGQYKSVDPGFAPVPFSQLPESTKKILAENGKQFGLDALGYYNARGGVDASGYYGDSWNAKENLTSQEYDAVIKGAIAKGLTGAQIGAAINEATAAKKSGSTINITTGAITASATPASSSASTSGAGSRSGFEGTGTPTVYTAEDGTKFTDQAAFTAYASLLQQQKATQGKVYEERRSAFQLLRDEFNRYGLSELVGDVEALIKGGLPPAEFAIELRKTPTYQKRFQANQQRINAGLRALSEAEYISLEDQYQNVMRQYGLPAAYYEKNQFGKQANLDKFIAGDVSPVELEERLQIGYKRVQDSNPEVLQALRAYYPNISNGDILAYVLDPKQAIQDINRKVTAAEIGGEAAKAGLSMAAPQRGITGVGVTDAEYLARYGVTKESARQGYQTISEFLPTATKLGDIYAKQGLGPYDQTTAEAEVFTLPGAAEAAQKRKRLTQLETAQFSGQTGVAQGALSRERAGQF
jgi:hypothetical protein